MIREIIQNCPICGSDSGIVEIMATINPEAADEVELRCCDLCGHWWHSPVPNQEELSELYRMASPFVVSAGAKESYQNKDRLDSFHAYVLKRINKAPGNYLEIGAGGGGLLRRFRTMGYTCYGVDPGQWVADSSIVKDIGDIPNELIFDVIILQDVLEHVLDPVGLMSLLKGKAREGTLFFCSFPCRDSRPASTYKGRWAMVRPYGHLHYFSFNSTKRMFSTVGLNPRDIRLQRITPISTMLASFNIRGLAYEILKGTKDQIFLQAVV